MLRARARSTVWAVIGLPIVAVVGFTFVQYRQDMGPARERVSTGSHVAQTPCGQIEYAQVGDGPPVLIVHGAGGGFDQGLYFADPFVQAGYRIISMSRFGYLRTPLPADAS